jgi:hypothetical protein
MKAKTAQAPAAKRGNAAHLFGQSMKPVPILRFIAAKLASAIAWSR